jgi:very-short-patch-repair endonuclease
MTKLEYITRQFSRAENKRFEHYVVTRIWHLLNDLSIKFVTQQYVTRPEGRALTDMFFHQLQVHIEIDEGHHKKQIEWDRLREADIINATGHEIIRIDVTRGIEQINEDIDEIVKRLRDKKLDAADFKAWDIDAEQNPRTYIEKGYIDLKDDVAFRTIVDAANCFGNNYKPKAIWTGGAKHPKEAGKIIWCPKLYKNGLWNNRISDDETTIWEISESPEIAQKHIDSALKSAIQKRIVFARVKGPLGDVMYRFKGEYQLDQQATDYQHGLVWRRISELVRTYKHD